MPCTYSLSVKHLLPATVRNRIWVRRTIGLIQYDTYTDFGNQIILSYDRSLDYNVHTERHTHTKTKTKQNT